MNTSIFLFVNLVLAVVLGNFLSKKVNRRYLKTKDEHYKYHYIAFILREDGKSFTIHLYSDYGCHGPRAILNSLWNENLQKYILSTPQGFIVLCTKKQLSEFKFEVKKKK